MDTAPLSLLRWQFEFTWSLFEYHLERVEEDDFLWEPAAECWTMRRNAEGGWEPDWADTEPDPVPAPTAAWVTWHIGWWWSVTLDHMHGRAPRERHEIAWPGPGEPTVAWLRDLRTHWLAALDGLAGTDLDTPAPFPWHDEPGMTLAHTIGWVNGELMKDAAEFGQLRMLRAVSAA
ncbi:DinB family protein [Streptomonospora sediminis]